MPDIRPQASSPPLGAATPSRRFGWKLTVSTVFFLVLAGWYGWTRFELDQAEYLISARRHEEAIVHLRRVLRLTPNRAEVHFLLARAYRRVGQTEQFRKALLASAESGGDLRRLEREQLLLAAQIGDLRSAAPHLQEMLMDPGEDGAEICEAFITGYFRNYQFERAMPLLNAWQADFPADAQPHVVRGIYENHLANFAESADSYRQALQIDPTRRDVRLMLARQLVKLHEYETAETEFRKCLVDDADPAVLTGLADCLLQMGRETDAEASILRALNMDRNNLVARFQLGRLKLSTGDYQDAVELLEKVVLEDPLDSEARYTLASALQASDRNDEAEPHLQIVSQQRTLGTQISELQSQLREQGEDPAKRIEIAELLFELKHTDEAIVWLKSVLDQDPSQQTALKRLRDHFERVGDLDTANQYRSMLEKTTESRKESE